MAADPNQTQDFFGATFAVEDEDHTLANSLRLFLNKKWVEEQEVHARLCWSSP
jgi:DNA-directed RNA polymerase subunit L